MERFNKIICIVLAGMLLTGCADKSIKEEVIWIGNDQGKQQAEMQPGAFPIGSDQKEPLEEVLQIKNTKAKEVQPDALQIDNNQKKAVQDANASKENIRKNEIQTEGWRIQPGCSKITDKMAQAVFEEVRELEYELSDGIYVMENSRIVFLNEEEAEDAVIVRAVFEADYTSIRKPEDHPLVRGMYEAKAELKSGQEKEDADAYIDGWLMELYPAYQKTARVPLNVAIKINDDQPQEYELYYPYVKNSKEKLKPLRQYAMKNWKEDKTEMKKMGRIRLLENVVHQ